MGWTKGLVLHNVALTNIWNRVEEITLMIIVFLSYPIMNCDYMFQVRKRTCKNTK